jgi:hypothetical protein
MKKLVALAIFAASMFAAVPTGTQKAEVPLPFTETLR